MATYTPLGFSKQATGENVSTWGTILNTQMIDLVDSAIRGMASLAISGGTYTLTQNNGAADESRMAILNITGALTSNQVIVVPNRTKIYLVINGTTGVYMVTVKTAAGTGIEVPQNAIRTLVCDGTNVLVSDDARAQAFEPLGAAPTFISTIGTAPTGTSSFSVPGDFTAVAPANTVLFIELAASSQTERVVSASFALGVTTFVVTSANGLLTNTMRRVAASFRGDRAVLSAQQIQGAALVNTNNTWTADQTFTGAKIIMTDKDLEFAPVTGLTPAGAALPDNDASNIGLIAAGNFASVNSGAPKILFVEFAGVSVLTHSATLPIPGAANYTTAANDTAILFKTNEGTNKWAVHILRADGYAMKERFGSLYCKIEDRKASGTTGDTPGSTGYNERTLNSVITDGIGVTLAANKIRLPVGTYYCRVTSPGSPTGAGAQLKHRVRLQNVTTAATLLTGSSESCITTSSSGLPTTTLSHAEGQFVVSSAVHDHAVQHYVDSTAAKYGVAVGSGEMESYTRIELWKIA